MSGWARADRWRTGLRGFLREVPVVLLAMTVGFVAFGALGGAVGLVIGLHVHPPTAWFAMLEIGLPTAGVGSVLGLVVGLIAHWILGAPAGGTPPVDDDFAGTPHRW